MEVVFGIVVVIISLTAGVLAFLAYLRVGELYRQIGAYEPRAVAMLEERSAERQAHPARSGEKLVAS